MNTKKLKEFIALAQEMGVTRLKYKTEEEEFEVDFSRPAPIVIPHSQVPSISSVSSLDSRPNSNGDSSRPLSLSLQEEQAYTQGQGPKISTTSSHFKNITSPFVGTFYIAPSPTAASFVKVGEKIKKGQVLCIIEAMKIMNEIESEIEGEIVEICIENETYVEFGQVLFKVK